MTNTTTKDGDKVQTILGEGVQLYRKADGWIGVRLDGETRVDEYPEEGVSPA